MKAKLEDVNVDGQKIFSGLIPRRVPWMSIWDMNKYSIYRSN